MRLFKYISLGLIAAALACVPSFAQTSKTGRVTVGPAIGKYLPCGDGDQYNTNDTTPSNVFTCKSNTWTQVSGGSGGAVSITGSGPIVVTPSPLTGTGVISCPTCGGVPAGPTTAVQWNNAGVPGGSVQFEYTDGATPNINLISSTLAAGGINGGLTFGGTDGATASWILDRRGGAIPIGMNMWSFDNSLGFVLRASYGTFDGKINFNVFQGPALPASTVFDPGVNPVLGAHWVTQAADPAGSTDVMFGLAEAYDRNADWFWVQNGSGTHPFRIVKQGGLALNADLVGPIVTTSLRTAGTGYVVNDTGKISGGNDGAGATYIVTSVNGMGAVTGYTITAAGDGYNVGVSNTLTGGGQPGVGANFSVNITAITPDAQLPSITANAGFTVTGGQTSFTPQAITNTAVTINGFSSSQTAPILSLVNGGESITNGFLQMVERTNPSGISTSTVISANSIAHTLEFNPNNTGWVLFAASDGTWISGHCLQATGPFTATDNGSGCGTGGTGTVTTLTSGDLAPIFTTNVSNPGTTPGITYSLSTALANKVLGNCTGSTATPAYCSITGAMLPNPTASTLGGIESIVAVSHQFVTSISTSGVPALAQPGFVDISGTIGGSQFAVFAAHTVWANCTNGSATPTSCLLGTNEVTPNYYVVGGGSVNVMTATLSPAATVYVAGMIVNVLPNLANTTTTPTLNVSGLGAKSITKFGTSPLVAGDYSTTAIATFIYDGTRFQLMNPQTANAVSFNTQTNGTNNISQTLLNLNSTSGPNGITVSNISGGLVQFSLAAGTGGGNANLQCTVTGGANGQYFGFSGGICQNLSPGVGVGAQTSGSYTFGPGDRGTIVPRSNVSGAMSDTLSSPATYASAGSGYYTCVTVSGSFSDTITSTATIFNGNASGTSILVLTGQSVCFNTDGTNWFARVSGYASGTTGTITGTSLTNSCDSGTVTINGATAGMPVIVSSATGADIGGAFNIRGSVTSSNTVTVYVCGSGVPSSLAYNVRVLP